MFAENYNSCMFEEICLIDIYGNEPEKRILDSYITGKTETCGQIVQIAGIIRERIVNRAHRGVGVNSSVDLNSL